MEVKGYVCTVCRHEFTEPDHEPVEDSYEFWGQTGTHSMVVECCPACGDEDFVDCVLPDEDDELS